MKTFSPTFVHQEQDGEENSKEGGVAGGVDMWNQKQLTSLPCSQVDNAGLYTCLAESPAGEVEKSFLVRVQGRGYSVRGRGNSMGPARMSPSPVSSYSSSPSKCCWAPGPQLCGWLGSRAADPGVLRGSRTSTRD